MPTFDVVVPCYNYGRFLERCVRSALDQKGADVRVLIIDDCSTDDSALVGQLLADKDPRVEFRRHEKNKGHIATYNEGLIGWAKGEYCLLLSADDALAPGAFERALKLFEASPDVGLVYGRARIIKYDDEFEFPANNDFTSSHIVSGREFLKYCCRFGNPVPTPTAIVRTNLQQSVGGYRSDLPHTGDLEMWMRFARLGAIGIVHSVQGEYRRHDTNMSNEYYAQVLSDKLEFEAACLGALEPLLATDPDARSWLTSMYDEMFSQAQRNALVAFDCGDVKEYEAWVAYAQRVSGHLPDPRQSVRLTIRKLLGQPVWQFLRRVRRIANPRLPDPRTFRAVWSPTHGDLIGVWPT